MSNPNPSRRREAPPAQPAEPVEQTEAQTWPVEPPPASEPPAAMQSENQIAVWDWALSQAKDIGQETAYAFALEYPTHTARPSELAAALEAFRNRVIG